LVHDANPQNWPLADLRSMMKTHLDLTLQEVSDQLGGNYAASVADYDVVETEILRMADTLSSGIIAVPEEVPLRMGGQTRRSPRPPGYPGGVSDEEGGTALPTGWATCAFPS
jgi:hypothetical protein